MMMYENEKKHPYAKCKGCYGKDILCKDYEPYSRLNDSCVLYKLRLEEFGDVKKHYKKISDLEKAIEAIDGWD